jgi:hypothetical protein
MLSISIDPWDRHDGDDVCSNLEKHPKTNLRIPRSIEEEAEIFDPNLGLVFFNRFLFTVLYNCFFKASK